MKLEFEGELTYVDGRYNVIISELQPSVMYKINLEVKYSWYECPLKSSVVYKSDERGIIDFNKMIAVKGKYKIQDSMALNYGLRYAKGDFYKRKERDFSKEYISYEYRVTGYGDTYQTKFVRKFTSEDIQCTKIRKEFVGDFYYHVKKSSKKILILLGGSEGVLNPNLPIAACLANKGIDVMAVQYFDPEVSDLRDILPERLERIPIEYIDSVVNWLDKQRPGKDIYIMGSSRGAELSLLYSSLNSRIKKVIALSPSAYVFQGCGTISSAWQKSGKAVPYIKINLVINAIEQTIYQILSILHVETRYFISYEVSRILALNKEKKRIKVEDIKGDICVIAGRKDRIWNSLKALKIIQVVLEKNNDVDKKQYKHQYWIYRNAGHCFYTPFIFPIENTSGGSKLDNYYANEDIWRKVIEFILA